MPVLATKVRVPSRPRATTITVGGDDQAHLQGVLARLGDLGAVILGLQRLG